MTRRALSASIGRTWRASRVLAGAGPRRGASGGRWQQACSAAAFAASWALAGPALACPNCAAGREARSQVWAEGFGLNLFIAILPFVIIGVVSAWADRLGRPTGAPAPGGDAAPAGRPRPSLGGATGRAAGPA